MPATKSISTLLMLGANTAGGTTTSAVVDLTTSYGGLIVGTIVNGATGPTVGCTAQCQTTTDNGTTWDNFLGAVGTTLANATTNFVFELPLSVIKARVVFSGNTGQAVMVSCKEQHATAI